jgi:hypothetical protein
MATVGAAMSVGTVLQVEALADVGHVERTGDPGFAVRATSIGARTRALLRIGGGRWPVRPYLGVGATLTRWRGETTLVEYEFNDLGQILHQGEVTRPWRSVATGFELAGGAELGSGRVVWRPEFAVRFSTGAERANETQPFASMIAGVTAVWR